MQVTVPVEKGNTVRVVQITDVHLAEKPGEGLLGMDTDASLAHIIELVQESRPQRDLILATGDLSNHGRPAAYRRFRDAVKVFEEPIYWLPGNHDDPAIMAEVCADGDEMAGQILVGDWQIIMLDSTIRREVGGRLAPSELQRMKDCIAAEPDRHALVCYHHHPLPMGCAWLDTQQIENADEFFADLDALPQVKGVLWGHVHQEFEGDYKGKRLMATPSTCVQFAKHSDDFKIDTQLPGYRWLDLHPDGRIESQVCRLVDVDLHVDYSSTGY